MTEALEQDHGRLFGIAYRMLGSVAEAEDAVQEAHARLAATSDVDEPAAWLTRVVTNVCIDRLRSAQRRRETYVGPWLPEPLLLDDVDPADVVGTAESLTLAFLVVLDRLSPVQRAVVLLHDVFGYPHEEVARMLDRTPAAVRKQASRARAALAEARPPVPDDPDRGNAVTEAFLAACAGGDLRPVLDLLAPDVVMTSDGGGRVSSARHPVEGAERVARFMLGLARQGQRDGWEVTVATVNGGPGFLAGRDGAVEAVFAVHVVAGRVAALHVVRNPDKLAALGGRRGT